MVRFKIVSNARDKKVLIDTVPKIHILLEVVASWLKSSIDAFQEAVNRDMDTAGLTQQQAIEKNASLLKRNTYTYLQPEQMHSFEGGYRSILLDNKLSIDADFYCNLYSNVIDQIEASIPNTNDAS